jgi:hypothetical protein
MNAAPTLAQAYPDTSAADFAAQPEVASAYQKFCAKRDSDARIASRLRSLQDRAETLRGELVTVEHLVEIAQGTNIATSLYENCRNSGQGLAAAGVLAGQFASILVLKTAGPELLKIVASKVKEADLEFEAWKKNNRSVLTELKLI